MRLGVFKDFKLLEWAVLDTQISIKKFANKYVKTLLKPNRNQIFHY